MVWFYRTHPKPDELFSSWIVRLSQGLAVKLQTFTVKLLGLPSSFWTGDVDRSPPSAAAQRLMEETGVPVERIRVTGLSAFSGFLWSEYRPRGSLPWILPIGRFGRLRVGYGQQFCPQCLLEDSDPYFRRGWRLAFNVTCEHHGSYLEDCCPHCRLPVAFHAVDFGVPILALQQTLVQCHRCGQDIRQRAETSCAPQQLIEFQSHLNEALQKGFGPGFPYSHLMFEGLRRIAKMLGSGGHCSRLRDHLLLQSGNLPLGVSSFRKRPIFEELRVGDRALILLWLADFLAGWPQSFVEHCRASRLTSSYIQRDRNSGPYWLSSVVREHLFDEDYAPCHEERQAVARYLDARGLPVNRYAIDTLLGLSSELVREKNGSNRNHPWNPRGPMHSPAGYPATPNPVYKY